MILKSIVLTSQVNCGSRIVRNQISALGFYEKVKQYYLYLLVLCKSIRGTCYSCHLSCMAWLTGLSEEPVQQEKEVVGSGGGGTWEVVAAGERRRQRRRKSQRKVPDVDYDYEGADDVDNGNGNSGGSERQREHPFIVTEPGEVARGKKNGLDYLFHLYEQCRDFLIQVQNIAKERGEKCPTKVHPRFHMYV